jgi:Transglycosylase SLT domain
MRPPTVNLLAATLIALWISPGSAEEQKPEAAEGKTEVVDICETLERAARENGLPVPFFTRLIWQESRFNATAVSPKGARGIAQFMLGTADMRGLINPFEPIVSLLKSAEYLRELSARFGNVGLAAAAYNAGERRVAEWLAGRGRLPRETRDYVRIITGHPVEAWTADKPPEAAGSATPARIRCAAIAGPFVAAPIQRQEPTGAWGPWGVQVAGHWSFEKVQAIYANLQRKFPAVMGERTPMLVTERGRGMASRTAARLPMQTREEGDALCERLRNAGGSCMVVKSPVASASR